jgi:ABC-2 type transport system permease protein
MLRIESKLSLRDMNMPIFALAMPVVVMVVIGAVFGQQPAYDGAPYSFVAQSFPAVSTIAIIAGGVMGLPMLIAEYRHRKVLKRYQVTPVTPGLILGVQLVVYSVYAVVSLGLVYAVAALGFGYRSPGSWLGFLGGFALVTVAMFSIGLLVGGLAPNPKIAGVIASLLYFPMLLLSGSTLPYEVMPPMMRQVADFLPATQGVKLLKATSLGLPAADMLLPCLTMAGLAVICTVLAVRFFRWE